MKKKILFVLCAFVSAVVTIVAIFRHRRRQYISK